MPASSCWAAITPTPGCRSASGWRTGSDSTGITTTGIGHLAQGFIPAIVAREILIRRSPLRGTRWLPFVTVCFCLALSAFYELVEFWTALGTGAAATDFLGTQGDPWDTQWDMMLALIGAILALALLSRWHDREIERAVGR